MKLVDKIAMKISEEEYNDILPILKENRLILGGLYWKKIRCYIVNKDCDVKNISLYEQADYNQERVLLPYNKELFLQYCGIEVGKEETFEEYTNRVNPSLYTSFLAEYEARVLKELKNRRPICTTEDGVELFGGEGVFGVTDDLQLCYTSLATKENIYRARIFSTQEAAEQYVAENTPQKTSDAFEITRGEEMWVVDTQFFKLHQSVGGHFKKDNGKHLLFKRKENAINHIVLNKLTLSLKDLDFIVGFGEERMNLINKVKEKLGFS